MVTDTLMVRDRILFLSFANGAVEDVAKLYASLSEHEAKKISSHLISLWNLQMSPEGIRECVDALVKIRMIAQTTPIDKAILEVAEQALAKVKL